MKRAQLSDFEATTAHGDGIIQVRLPMAGNPLRYINGYLVAEDDGLTLIDAGWKADDVLAALHAGLQAHGYRLGDIRRLVVTHAHFDHYGLAATLMRAGIAELGMHVRDWELARATLSDPAGADRVADAWIERNGLRVDTLLEDELHHHRTELAPPTREIADGERIGRLQAYWTPGHTPGHLCFFDLPTATLFSGDHILDPITPHVGIWRAGDSDPLGDYIRSLHVARTSAARRVFPAHGEPFADLGGRVDALLAHEARREAQIQALLGAEPLSGADIARALPWTRRNRNFSELNSAHQQFAVAETLAHLERLRRQAYVRRDERNAAIVYRRAVPVDAA